jgi:hypothetical protein
VPVFQNLGTFLGMSRYLTVENMDRYTPRNQREFCSAVRRNTLSRRLTSVGQNPHDDQTELILEWSAQHVRIFRTAHCNRVIPYLE